MSYNPDPNVVSAIRRIGRKRGVPDRWIETALATGLVESGLQNLSSGDADSAGWRQDCRVRTTESLRWRCYSEGGANASLYKPN
jgi:hypothetical protein